MDSDTQDQFGTGVSFGNLQLDTSGENNIFNLISNLNSSFTGSDNNLTCRGAIEVSFQGSGNSVTFEFDTKVNFSGNDNSCDFKSNTQFKLNGNQNQCTINHNTNSEMTGNGNTVLAESNVNMKVFGDGHNLKCKGTINHVFQPSNNLGDGDCDWPMNNIKIMHPPIQESIRLAILEVVSHASFDCHMPPPTCFVEYVKEARVETMEYAVGIFNFKMAQFGDEIKAELVSSQLDTDSFSTCQESDGLVIISGMKDGRKEKLAFYGPNVNFLTTGDTTVVSIRDGNNTWMNRAQRNN